MRESWRKAKEEQKNNNLKVEIKSQRVQKINDSGLHDLILSDVLRWLGTLHHISRCAAGIQILDKGNSQRTTSVLVASELGWKGGGIVSTS